MSSIKPDMASEKRLPLQQLVVYGMGGIIPIALFNIAGQLIGLIGNISLGLSAFWLGTILIIPRLWDAVSDPIAGHLSDNTRTRWGRRRPYILIGGIAVAMSFVMMWWVPQRASVQSWFSSESAFESFQLVYILMSLLIFFTATTLFEIPHGALGMEMTQNSHERTRLFSAKSFFGNLFAMATPWLFALAGLEIFKGPGGTEADGMRYVSILVAIVLIPLSIWWFITLREPTAARMHRAATHTRSKFWTDMKNISGNKDFIFLVVTVFTLSIGFNFVGLLNYYISIFYLYGGDKSAAGTLLGINGTVWAVTGLLAVFPLNWLAPKLGKSKTLIMAIGLMCAAQGAKIFCYNPTYPYLVIIPTVLLSAGMLFFFTLSTSMLGDICDEDDLRTGKRNEGSYYSVYWWFIKMGTAFASFVTGILILFTQFDETQVTRVDQLRGNMNEIQSEVEVWVGHRQEPDQPLLAKVEDRLLDAEEKIKDLSAQIENNLALIKELAPALHNLGELIPAELQELTDRNTARIFSLKTLSSEFKSRQTISSADGLQNFINRFLPLSLSLRLDRANLSAIALQLHFLKHNRVDDQEREHREMLGKNLALIQSQLTTLVHALIQQPGNPSSALLSIKSSLPSMDRALSRLTGQTPQSLFMMRLIEITLPILLCLISLLFALKYSLTSQRCHEIQVALRERNEGNLN